MLKLPGFPAVLLCCVLAAASEPAWGWSSAHAKITRAALDVQTKELRQTWSAPYQHPHDDQRRTIDVYLVEYAWWSGNPDHLEGPLNATNAYEERKHYVKQFVYGEKDGRYAVPSPYGVPADPNGGDWGYHYFSFSEAENLARATRGGQWYFEKMQSAFRDNRPADAAQLAASLAHAIEDRSSTVHAWDGYGALRAKVEARYRVDSEKKFGMSVFWFIDDKGVDASIGDYQPRLLGTTPAAAGRQLAQRLQRVSKNSRIILSHQDGYVGPHLKDDWKNAGSSPATDAAMSRMAQESTRLTADMFFTAYSLAQSPDATR